MIDQQNTARVGPFAQGQLDMPFYTDMHRALAARLEDWIDRKSAAIIAMAHRPVPVAARALVQALAADGWLRVATEGDMQSICLCRQAFAWLTDLCDYAFALQGLTAKPLKTCRRDDLVEALASGQAIGALALTELSSGSDLASIATIAERTENGYRLSGEKAWIGHAGVADLVVVLARTGGAGAFGLSLFAVPTTTPNLQQKQGPEMLAPRALGQFALNGVDVSSDALLGAEGMGFVYAINTIESFRMSVGAAANGFARRALGATVSHVIKRKVQNGMLAEMQLVQAALADMQVKLNAAELLVAQAAWEWDRNASGAALRSSSAKLLASETAQGIVDKAVQLLGATGVSVGSPTEQLYRQVRSLRIYEGASEIQQLMIGKAVAAGQI